MVIVRRCERATALLLWGLVILLVAAVVNPGEGAGQEPHRAGLVVDFGDGQTESSCVEFSEDEITGADLLRRSGLGVVFSEFGGLGSAVCQIEGTGCNDPGDCFCQCRGADCAYWSYWKLENDEWRFQQVAASARRLRDGDVDGWVWGPGRSPPAETSFAQLCPLARRPSPQPVATDAPPPVGAGEGETEQTSGSGPSSGEERAEAPSSAGAGTMDERADAGVGAREATPPSARQTATRETDLVRGEPSGSERRSGRDGAAAARESGGPPTGLIAFGAVAGALIALAGGVVWRRRLRG